jgi:hypothetical protein
MYRWLTLNIAVVGINVPRRRFLPVKTTSDLLVIMSNLYSLHMGNLAMNPKRSFPSVPLVKLGTSFSKVLFVLLFWMSMPTSTLTLLFVCYLINFLLTVALVMHSEICGAVAYYNYSIFPDFNVRSSFDS